jgi:hypothetical protein
MASMRLSTIFTGTANRLAGSTTGNCHRRPLASVGTQSYIRSATAAAVADRSGAGMRTGRKYAAWVAALEDAGACVQIHAAFVV